jgi:hypothetical protein
MFICEVQGTFANSIILFYQSGYYEYFRFVTGYYLFPIYNFHGLIYVIWNNWELICFMGCYDYLAGVLDNRKTSINTYQMTQT